MKTPDEAAGKGAKMSEQKILTFRVNGSERTVTLEGWERLLDVLRERLGLTGTKRGCDDASCGACTVILNGKAVRSCITPVSKAQGADVRTIEDVARGTELHPVQRALIEAGAVQCGYCIPGIVMELVALFDADPRATSKEITNAMEKHLCRCTGYEALMEGAFLAQKLLAGQTKVS